MNGLNFTLCGWNDTENFQRKFIVCEVAKKLNEFYKNDYINNYHLQIYLRNAILCDMDLEHPCTHPDRSKICITEQGGYWCQFIFQFSHELCHCTTSRKSLPQSIKWFDEFICCFTSYFVLKQFEHNYEVISQLYSNNTSVFSDYLQQRSAGHIYSTQNTRSMFSEFYAAYLEDENLIKNHDVYYINFFNALNGNYNGLSFIGKIHEVDTNNTNTIEEFLIKLKQFCNNVEIETINLVCDIFGIQTNDFGKGTYMKDSGIEWIGQIPEDWELHRLKGYLTEIKDINSPIKTTQVLSLTNKLGVIPYEEKGEQGNKSKENHDEYKLAYPDTIVANCMNILIGSVGICNCFGCVSPVYYVFKPKAVGTLKFLNFIFQSQPFQKELRRYAKGIMEIRLRVSANDILGQFVAFPSMHEQKRIVNFLENKLSYVDNLIANQYAQIEKLKEYKQAVITEVVTKGLDKTAPLKDSGIEWIGEIPETWEVIRGKNILELLDRAILSTDDVITCFRDGEVTLRKNRREEGFTFSEKEIGYQGVNVGDLVVHGMDGFAGAIGISDSRGKASPVLIVLNSKQNKRYLMYYLRSMAYRDIFLALSTGIRVRSCDLRWNKLSAFPFLMPSIEEQNQIVNYIDTKLKQIDNLISIKQQKIETLQEYKKSLIYEYVTGKKEVA